MCNDCPNRSTYVLAGLRDPRTSTVRPAIDFRATREVSLTARSRCYAVRRDRIDWSIQSPRGSAVGVASTMGPANAPFAACFAAQGIAADKSPLQSHSRDRPTRDRPASVGNIDPPELGLNYIKRAALVVESYPPPLRPKHENKC